MIIANKNRNNLYLSFRDFEDKEKDIYFEIKKEFPKEVHLFIENFLSKNFFSNSLERQKSYISAISTYIDISYIDGKKPYFLSLYILPKDINIDFSGLEKSEKIKKIELLTIKLFKAYGEILTTRNKSLELFENFKGDSFLQLEANFYLKKLDKIYSYLLNFKTNHKNTIICSDKKIGIEIESLNIVENNPLKIYQFIKTPYQKDLICFVYSLMSFLKKYRLEVFNCEGFRQEHKKLLKSTNKINNLLLKISSRKHLINNNIERENLKKYFLKYKNTKELKQNKKLYKIIKSIFYTQLKENIQFFQSIGLTKVFEKVVQNKLSLYRDSLYMGEETGKKR